MTIRGVHLYPIVGTVGGTTPTGTGTAGQGAVWTGTTIVEDGSGLSYDNQATPVLRSVTATEMTAPTPTVTPHVAGKGSITTTTVAARAVGTITCVGVASRATGTITCVAKSALVDGETVVIDDGIGGSETFEFDVAGDGVAGGNVQVNVSTDTTAEDVAARLTTAINATFPTIATDNLDGTISLVSNSWGTAGNIAITDTVTDSGFVVAGMSGAVDGIEDGDTVTVDDGTNPATTFEFEIASSGVVPGNVAVAVLEGAPRADVASALSTEINTIVGGLLISSTPNALNPHVLDLQNSQFGVVGNVALSTTVTDPGFTLVGMSDGLDGILDGETVTLNDGTASYVFEFDLDSSVTLGNQAVAVLEGASANDVRDALITAINGTAILMTAASGGAGSVRLEMDAGSAGGANSETVVAAAFAVTGMTVTAATAWAYKVVAKLADGTQTSAGSAGNTAAGAASLDANEYNTVAWSAVAGASSYDVYRTTAGTSPATTGKIASTTATTVNDTGLTGDGSTPPAQNQTGLLAGAATRLATLTAPVVISSAAAPTAGQVLAATSPVAASWTSDLTLASLAITSGGSASLGAELLTNAGLDSDLSSWTPGANWAWNAGAAQHTAGSTAPLAQSVSVTSGNSYQVSFVITGRTAGSISVALGAVVLNASGTTTWTASNTGTGIVAGASGSVALTITPTTDFDGSLDSVSIKLITASSPAITINDGGVTAIAVRGSATLDNTFVGDMAGRMDTTGTSNSGMGVNALYSNTTGGGNSAVGASALYSNTTGGSNSAVGTNALRGNTTGINNSAVGTNALRGNTTGNSNSAVGSSALYSNTTGGGNSAVGASALYSNTTGASNSAMGLDALRSNTTGTGNSAVGPAALYSNTTGGNNTAIGKDAGYASGASPSTANAVTTGSNNTFVGYQSGLGSATQRSNSTAIGSGAYVNADNTVVLGNGSVTDVLMGSTAGAYANAAGLKSPTATHQLGGGDSATPVAQTLQVQGARGGTDTNVKGANFTARAGAGTGSAGGGDYRIQRYPAGSSGTTANTPSDALVIASKQVTLTESSATPVLDISIASGTVTGGTLWYTIRADDGADLQALRGQVQFAAVNKGGTITVIPSTPEETTAPSAGTLTNTVTITTGTNMITLNLNAVSSLTQTTLVAYISAQIDGLGTVTTK